MIYVLKDRFSVFATTLVGITLSHFQAIRADTTNFDYKLNVCTGIVKKNSVLKESIRCS